MYCNSPCNSPVTLGVTWDYWDDCDHTVRVGTNFSLWLGS